MLASAAAFFLGRWSATRELPPSAESAESAAEREEREDENDPDSASDPQKTPAHLAAINTSTTGLCPCPRPRPPSTLAIKRKPKAPVNTPPHEGPDPTEATARYLRERAQDLGQCAPKAGGEVRVHLEVTVMPKGTVERVRITNLDPLPALVSECVTRTVLALSPPGFDASRSEVFALTVVL